MKIKVLLTTLILLLTGVTTSVAKEPIFTDNISDMRKLLYGEKETFISCWSTTKGNIYLDVKVNGKWMQKAKTSLKKDSKNCIDKKYPGVSKLIWTPDELSSVKGEGRTYILEVRERVGSISKPTYVSNFTIPIYRSSNDLLTDVVEGTVKLPSQAPTSTPIPVPTQVPVPTPIPEVLPSLVVGQMYSGIDVDNSTWKWIAVRLSNSSTTKILSGSSNRLITLVDANGGVVDSSGTSIPALLPGASGWVASTQFNIKDASRAIIENSAPKISAISATEFPAIFGVSLVSAATPGRKSIQMTLQNKSQSLFLDRYTRISAVVLGSSGVPIYAISGYPDVWIAPGGSSTVSIGAFTLLGSASSIEVSVQPSLCKVPSTAGWDNCIYG
jgi:hypothetical protein